MWKIFEEDLGKKLKLVMEGNEDWSDQPDSLMIMTKLRTDDTFMNIN